MKNVNSSSNTLKQEHPLTVIAVVLVIAVMVVGGLRLFNAIADGQQDRKEGWINYALNTTNVENIVKECIALIQLDEAGAEVPHSCPDDWQEGEYELRQIASVEERRIVAEYNARQRTIESGEFMNDPTYDDELLQADIAQGK